MLIHTALSSNQDHLAGRVPAPDPSADQEAGGTATEGVLQRRPHHPAPTGPGGKDCGPVQEPDEEVRGYETEHTSCGSIRD